MRRRLVCLRCSGDSMSNDNVAIPAIRGKNSGTELLEAARFLHSHVVGKQPVFQLIYRIIFIALLSGVTAWAILGSITGAIVGASISVFCYYFAIIIEYGVRSSAISALVSEPEFVATADSSGLTQTLATRTSQYPWSSIEYIVERRDSVVVVVSGFHLILIKNDDFESETQKSEWLKSISEKSGVEVT
jgi:hypothetical protein